MRAYCRESSTSNVKRDNITLNLAVPQALSIYLRRVSDSRTHHGALGYYFIFK